MPMHTCQFVWWKAWCGLVRHIIIKRINNIWSVWIIESIDAEGGLMWTRLTDDEATRGGQRTPPGRDCWKKWRAGFRYSRTQMEGAAQDGAGLWHMPQTSSNKAEVSQVKSWYNFFLCSCLTGLKPDWTCFPVVTKRECSLWLFWFPTGGQKSMTLSKFPHYDRGGSKKNCWNLHVRAKPHSDSVATKLVPCQSN